MSNFAFIDGNANTIRPADEGCVEVEYRDFPAAVTVPAMARRPVVQTIDHAKLEKARADAAAVAAACGWV
jgi:hypothetical protein